MANPHAPPAEQVPLYNLEADQARPQRNPFPNGAHADPNPHAILPDPLYYAVDEDEDEDDEESKWTRLAEEHEFFDEALGWWRIFRGHDADEKMQLFDYVSLTNLMKVLKYQGNEPEVEFFKRAALELLLTQQGQAREDAAFELTPFLVSQGDAIRLIVHYTKPTNPLRLGIWEDEEADYHPDSVNTAIILLWQLDWTNMEALTQLSKISWVKHIKRNVNGVQPQHELGDEDGSESVFDYVIEGIYSTEYHKIPVSTPGCDEDPRTKILAQMEGLGVLTALRTFNGVDAWDERAGSTSHKLKELIDHMNERCEYEDAVFNAPTDPQAPRWSGHLNFN